MAAKFSIPHFRGGSLELLYNHDHECLLSGPADCVAWDTRILTPAGEVPIGWLCENKIAPVVMTLNGWEQAEVPFLKGRDWLHEVTNESGAKFKGTMGHRVLACSGYIPLAHALGQRLASYVPCLQESISEHIRSAHEVRLLNASSIRRAEYGNFYDLTVPKAAHYFAEGFIHHNTSKTWSACVKSFLLCSDPTRPGVHGLMVRKTFKSIHESGGRTFDTITKGMPIRRLGGKGYTDRWIFPNGSELVCCGLDNPEKMLGSEWDFIQVLQAEQLTKDDWEMIGGRCTGRGAVVAFPQIFGDCNPAGSKHWIRKRKSLTLLKSVHKDNPALYDDAGNMTEVGRQRIGILESTLTGVRRKRLLEGIWASSEGAVYDTFDPAIHVKERDPGEFKRFMLAIDEGYTNPAVILLCGDDSDGRRHVFREFYQRGVLQGDMVKVAQDWFREPFPGKRCILAAVDAAAAGLIADLVAVGVHAVGGKGRVIDGIQKIQDRLKVAGDGKPRLTIDPSCVEMVNEFESYVWKPDAPKDTPVKEHDHCSDSCRYLEDVDATPDGSFRSAVGLKVGKVESVVDLPSSPSGGLATSGKGFF